MTDTEDRPAETPVAGSDAARLHDLHEATRDLMAAQTATAVADVATETAAAILGLETNAVFFAEEDHLRPVSYTSATAELFGSSIPSLRRGESIGWRVFERGEAAVFDDIRDAEVMQNPETRMRSELILPLGSHGIFIAGSTTPAEFSDADVSLAKVFAANVEAALDRAEREARLTAQNERLDQFAAVVSHDIRNPLNVAQGRLELVREECSSPHLDDVERAHERIEGLLKNLLRLARDGQQVGDVEPVDLADVVKEAESDVPSKLRVVVECDAGADDAVAMEADRGRLRELLSNLLANAADHGAETVHVGWISDEKGFFVADDGPGIPVADRERVFEHGFTTDEDGSGFGLAIVQDIAEAHGWTVSVTESESGGARIEVRTDPEAPVSDE